MVRLLSLLSILLMVSLPVWGSDYTVIRDKKGFPRCIENFEGKNLFFKYARRSVTRAIRYSHSKKSCKGYKGPFAHKWKLLDDSLRDKLPEYLRFELDQIGLKANEFRQEKTAAEFIDSRNITTYTRELNRELTPKYGPIFSAEVFRELTERQPGNREFRSYVLSVLRKNEDISFEDVKTRVKLVVSFGLGWSHKYGITAPYYIKDFLSDIESMGLEVVYLEKNPFGRVDANVSRIIPQLEKELKEDKEVIFLSLCKGTPELFSAISEISDPDLRKKIIGHVNLSGMLSGTFFADIALSVAIPKLASPFLKILPFEEMKSAGKMISSTSYMRSSVISETLEKTEGRLPEDVLTINITGAPMSDRVMKNGSPMAPVIKYNFWQKFLVSANDGFIELPHTLVPTELAARQQTLVIDSTHMLSDGYLEEFALEERTNRRRIYQSILRYLLNNK